MSYIITVAVNIAIFALLALSLNIITGYAGQSAMGHAAFFGIGASSNAGHGSGRRAARCNQPQGKR